MTNILAIDPGTTHSAWCLYNGGKIEGFGKQPNDEVLGVIRSNVFRALAVEMISSYGMPVGKEVFETCVWIGRFTQAHEGPCFKVYRLEVKMHLCKSPKANDSTIRQALIDKLGKPGTKKDPGPTYGISKDVWAALGVAVTADEVILRRGNA